jgi:hypothetical protein
MASNTKNVKLGVCKVIYNGTDLGYTSGGVEVTVATDTHKVMVDQFGKTPINEYIMGRTVSAKCPLAETTLENMVAIMPGATLTTVGGAAATGSITVTTNLTDGQTLVVNGITLTAKTVPVANTDFAVGGSSATTATNLQQALANDGFPEFGDFTATVSTNVVTLTAKNKGAAANAITLATGTAGASITMSGATLSGGTDPTSKSVDVGNGVGTNLLAIAKPLRLHPVGNLDTDVSDDFVIPLAATAGALKFAYKLEDERVYDTEFTGYADPVTGKLFTVGK